jgi:hypothetical protein
LRAVTATGIVGFIEHEVPHLKPHPPEKRLNTPRWPVGERFAEQDRIDVFLDFPIYRFTHHRRIEHDRLTHP